jgi:hypothetical protein
MKKYIDMHRLLKPYEGRTIKTYKGKPNRIIDIENESVLVGTMKSPSGEPVVVDDIRESLERLLEEGQVMYKGAAPRSNRDSFVVAFLLSLDGVQKHPNSAGAIVSDRVALERLVYAEGV